MPFPIIPIIHVIVDAAIIGHAIYSAVSDDDED